MAKKKKKEKWLKFRHKVVTGLLRFTLGVYTRIKYGVKVKKFKEQQKRPYLVLFNHQTAFDQFFVGMAFKGPIYYLASEDIFSKGWVSSLIRYLVAPIPIKKQTADIKAILNCLRVAREGGTIAIAPEGNRTYHGRTVYMSPSIVPLAKKLGMPIALLRIEGGFGVHPRWSDVVRKGKMKAYVSEVIYPEQYKDMSDDELFSIIRDGLYVDEANDENTFSHKKKAEYLERALYVCPDCGLSTLQSNGDIISCTRCGKQVRYTESTRLCGVDRELPFKFVADWYDYQSDYINSLDVTQLCDSPLYEEHVTLCKVIPYKKKIPISDNTVLRLFGNRITTQTEEHMLEFSFETTAAVTVLGKNKLNIYHGDTIYQIKGSKRFNALKYVHFYNRYKNMIKGDENGKFLGL